MAKSRLRKHDLAMLSVGELADLRADAEEALTGSPMRGAVLAGLDRLLSHYGYLLRANAERIHGARVAHVKAAEHDRAVIRGDIDDA